MESQKIGCHPEIFQWFTVSDLQKSLCPMATLKGLQCKMLFKFYLPKGLYTITEVGTMNTPGSKHSSMLILGAKDIYYR